LRGDLLDFTTTPGWGRADDPAVRWRPNHWVLIEHGRIVAVQSDAPGPGWHQHDHAGRLILPGFIDTHVHSPQLDVIASYGTALLDWLETYTFPAERRYADPGVAFEGASRFLDALLAHGTTAAVVFPTVHKVSAQALFEQAQARGMRLIAGKVLMDRHAPDGLRDDVTQAQDDCRELIERWHGRDRLAYAVTVRFAPTSTPEQLSMAGQLCAQDPTLYFQTHVAENLDEVRWVSELFPHARSYLEVYEQAGLLHPRSVLAHGLWLDDLDRRLLAERRAQIAHSPSSNLFLGSGLIDWLALRDAGVAVSVASDVGGGTSLCLLRNLSAAYQIQALRGQRLTAWSALAACTHDAAHALHLSAEIGTIEPGRLADLTVWDWARDELTAHRLSLARSLHERVFAWMMLADERHLRQTWVAGLCVHDVDLKTLPANLSADQRPRIL
jgi:guanine deaminase